MPTITLDRERVLRLRMKDLIWLQSPPRRYSLEDLVESRVPLDVAFFAALRHEDRALKLEDVAELLERAPGASVVEQLETLTNVYFDTVVELVPEGNRRALRKARDEAIEKARALAGVSSDDSTPSAESSA